MPVGGPQQLDPAVSPPRPVVQILDRVRPAGRGEPPGAMYDVAFEHGAQQGPVRRDQGVPAAPQHVGEQADRVATREQFGNQEWWRWHLVEHFAYLGAGDIGRRRPDRGQLVAHLLAHPAGRRRQEPGAPLDGDDLMRLYGNGLPAETAPYYARQIVESAVLATTSQAARDLKSLASDPRLNPTDLLPAAAHHLDQLNRHEDRWNNMHSAGDAEPRDTDHAHPEPIPLTSSGGGLTCSVRALFRTGRDRQRVPVAGRHRHRRGLDRPRLRQPCRLLAGQ